MFYICFFKIKTLSDSLNRQTARHEIDTSQGDIICCIQSTYLVLKVKK